MLRREWEDRVEADEDTVVRRLSDRLTEMVEAADDLLSCEIRSVRITAVEVGGIKQHLVDIVTAPRRFDS